MTEIVLNLGPRPAEELRLLTEHNFKQLPFVDGETYGGVLWEGNHYAILTKLSQMGTYSRWTATVGISKIEEGFKEYLPLVALGELCNGAEEPYIFTKEFIENGLKYVMKRVKEKEEQAENERRI